MNQYTGNLVWVHEDLGFGGNRMPVSINHVYNANDNAITRFGTGVGWRTNFNQRVFVWSKNENYYVWEDADGTDHYFLYDSANTYKDEDGLELTLTTGGSGTSTYKITDKNGNISYFDAKGRLCKQTNNQATKSSITVTYTTTSGYLINTVTDGAGRVYKFTYTDDLLTKIAYLGSGTTELSSVSYGYTDSKLTKITYKDGKSATFSYAANNLLSSATDIDGYTLNYAYNTTTSGQPNRISKISEFDGSVAGGVLNFQYAHNQTTLTDHNGNIQVLQFNNLGNTVCVQDGEGHAQYYQYTKNESGDSGKGNQLTASSKLQNTVGNRRVEYVCKGYHGHGKEFCSSHRIYEETIDAQVMEYAALLHQCWQAEQAELRRLHKLWSLRQPMIEARIAELREEIRQDEEDIDELLMLKIRRRK